MPELAISAPVSAVVLGKAPSLSTFETKTNVVVAGTKTSTTNLPQVAGFIPLTDCSESECRTPPQICGDCNTVFGNIVDGKAVAFPSYENDFNSFLINYRYGSHSGPSLVFYLQKLNGNTWENAATLNNNNYGTFYSLGIFTTHTFYQGYKLNWGAVLLDLGVGIYRIKATAASVIVGVTNCVVSKEFNLLAWNCEQANGTVKFETYTTGKIGDKRQDYLLHDFSDITWYDSIRLNGYLGYEKIVEYKRVNLEWGNPYHGKIQKVRDEAVQGFEFNMRQDTPKFIHDGLMVYGMMADQLFVSDYNLFNADYNIKQLGIVADSNYEPTYYNYRRTAMVKLQFKRAVQGVIKTNC